MRRVLKVLTYTLGVALLIAVGLVAYIRFAPDDARIWHVDPAGISRTGKPNDYYIAEGGDERLLKGNDQADAWAKAGAKLRAPPCHLLA